MHPVHLIHSCTFEFRMCLLCWIAHCGFILYTDVELWLTLYLGNMCLTRLSRFPMIRLVHLSALAHCLSGLALTLLSDWVTILSFTVTVGNRALYKTEINQIMLKSPLCGCVTNLGCPYNLSQMMTEEGNKEAYSHHHCHTVSPGRLLETGHTAKKSSC